MQSYFAALAASKLTVGCCRLRRHFDMVVDETGVAIGNEKEIQLGVKIELVPRVLVEL